MSDEKIDISDGEENLDAKVRLAEDDTDWREKYNAEHIELNLSEQEIERQVLGAAILMSDEGLRLPIDINERHFYKTLYKTIFEAYRQLIFENKPVNVHSLALHIRDKIKPDYPVNIPEIATITDNIFEARANFPMFLDALRENYEIRGLKRLASEMMRGVEQKKSSHEINEMMVQHLEKDDLTNIKSIMSGDDFLDECKHYNAEKNFNPTIFGDVQCPRGTLSYIGARPGGGKTTAMVNVAREALDSGRKVIFVNLEMLNREITTNLCLSYMFSSASEAQREILIDTERPKKAFYSLFREGVVFRNKNFITLRQEAINKVTGLMNRQNLVVFNGMGRGLSQLLSNIRDLADAKGDFKEIVVIVDYIQRMPTDENKKVLARWLEMKEASNRLLGLAVKKELVIIAGAQFNREKTDDYEADLENFAESSDIARDAYNAIRIDRDGLGIKILKARDGCKRDSFPLVWTKPYFFMEGPNEAMLQKLEKIPPKIPMNRDPEIVRQNTVRHILDPNARDPITGLTDDEAEYILLRGGNENDGKEGESHARKNKKH